MLTKFLSETLKGRDCTEDPGIQDNITEENLGLFKMWFINETQFHEYVNNRIRAIDIVETTLYQQNCLSFRTVYFFLWSI
jgi:hypothetical protein